MEKERRTQLFSIKVARLYAPLLYKLAEKGIDCYLVDMPFRLAIFNINAIDNIINKYKYDNWYLMGHSY